MQRRRKDLGGAQDGKTKLANCVFFVVLATRRSQRRTNGYGGIWCKGQVSLPALKLPLVHSHHVGSRICRVILQLWHYQGRPPSSDFHHMLLTRSQRDSELFMEEKSD